MPQPVDGRILGKRHKILLYGEGGSGKTFTAGTMPGNIYIIVFGGPNEITTYLSPDFRNKHPQKKDKLFFDFATEEVGERGHFVEADAYDHACDLVTEALEMEKRGEFSFDSIVIDSATGLRRYGMNKALEFNYARATQKDKATLANYRKENIIVPADNDWGAEQSLTLQFIEWLFKLDKHICLVTHEWTETKQDRGSRQTTVLARRPLFTGRHRIDIPAWFDFVWRITPKKLGQGIIAQAQPYGDNVNYAKTRLGGILPPEIRDPNLEELFAQIEEEVNAS